MELNKNNGILFIIKSYIERISNEKIHKRNSKIKFGSKNNIEIISSYNNERYYPIYK